MTRDKTIVLRVRSRQNGEIDFDELCSMADRLPVGSVGREMVLSFPENFVPAERQIGHTVQWGDGMRWDGGNPGIVTADSDLRERLNEPPGVCRLRMYESEDELYR